MDSDFERRWRNGLPPFDGLTVTLDKYIPLTLLRQGLAVIVQSLHGSSHEDALLRLADWHEHDGFVSETEPASWQELEALLVSEETLKTASLGDTYVRRSFFPSGRDWYLRIYVPDVYDNPFHSHDDPNLVHCGIFDVSCQASLVGQIAKDLESTHIANVVTTPAKEFFDSSYGG